MPAVSIVTATYNRGNVLRYTIESLLASTFADWELIVAGDACTDDTADVVASFADPRIRFVNLERNHGEQSAPNNAGVALASGKYIAFLNHDDLWTREHLAVCLDEIERANADVVFTLTIAISGDDVFLTGLTRNGSYDRIYGAPASSWLVRREAFERVGPWRDARTIVESPSQDWLLRASNAGLAIHAIPRATVIAVQSAGDRNSYRDRLSARNRECADSLRDDPHYIEKLLARIAIRESLRWRGTSVAPLLTRAAKNAFLRFASLTDSHPLALRTRKRGAAVNRLRALRGLPPLGERTS